jgi:hypothetical protein
VMGGVIISKESCGKEAVEEVVPVYRKVQNEETLDKGSANQNIIYLKFPVKRIPRAAREGAVSPDVAHVSADEALLGLQINGGIGMGVSWGDVVFAVAVLVVA